MTKAEIASEIYSRMSRKRMSATPVRGAEHSDSSQIRKDNRHRQARCRYRYRTVYDSC